MEMKSSRRGKYLSVTCVIRATSREQLDGLYQELCDHPLVVMVL
jgi:putative lipoic acid-binding regulatory protein